MHIVPGENGQWNVIDFQRRGTTFSSKAKALQYAKQLAIANQPSQVVLFDPLGNVEPIAHYQLPAYQSPHPGEQRNSVFEAAVIALLIGGFVAAGIAVLGDLVDRVERDARKESSKPRRRTGTPRRSRAA